MIQPELAARVNQASTRGKDRHAEAHTSAAQASGFQLGNLQIGPGKHLPVGLDTTDVVFAIVRWLRHDGTMQNGLKRIVHVPSIR